MENSLFRSHTYGIGQLISQKKRLEVPLYQRNYSWGPSEVEQFLDDIINAIEDNYPSYFLGSILLTQPEEQIWGILDGQQRLTTVSIVYSTIRFFLYQKNKNSDADQIASEFLGIRVLGGDYHARILLNAENRDLYSQAVVELCSDEHLVTLTKTFTGNRSNLLILKAIYTCRKKLSEWINSKIGEEINFLYRLSDFLEKRILVVAIEVSDESDAYIAFETLNTRGQDLSALDLVKNYIFSTVDKSNHENIRRFWSQMKENIGERQADDFLRIFWMGNFGLIQKARLYSNLKEKFDTPTKSLALAEKLCFESRIYAAIEDAKHEFWQDFTPFCRHLIEILNILKSKQTRPIIFACANISGVSKPLMESILWNLVVLTVRFQTIGKKRQGILEKQCAKIAEEISDKKNIDLHYVTSEIERFIPGDSDFLNDFQKYQEVSSKRALYFLSTIEYYQEKKPVTYKEIWETIDEIIDPSSNRTATHIFPKASEHSWPKALEEHEDIDALSITSNIANWMLIGPETRLGNRNLRLPDLKLALGYSQFWSTRKVSEYDQWDLAAFRDRQDTLRVIAAQVWVLKRENKDNG